MIPYLIGGLFALLALGGLVSLSVHTYNKGVEDGKKEGETHERS